jgi:hypothetical protein
MYLTLNTISPPKVVTQLPKPNKDLSRTPLEVKSDPEPETIIPIPSGSRLAIKRRLVLHRI